VRSTILGGSEAFSSRLVTDISQFYAGLYFVGFAFLLVVVEIVVSMLPTFFHTIF